MRSWTSFWIGIAVGLPLGVLVTAAIWMITTKLSVPRLRVRSVGASSASTPVRLGKVVDGQGRATYSFCVANVGDRDAVDVTVACTLFSRGSTGGDRMEAIAVPLAPSRLDVLSGFGRRRRVFKPKDLRSIDKIRARTVTLVLDRIADAESTWVDTEVKSTGSRDSSTEARVPLEERMRGGQGSFLSLVVEGRDSASGRRVVALQEFSARDIADVRA
jgi:hypothetical protein